MKRALIFFAAMAVAGCTVLSQDQPAFDAAYPPALQEVHFESHGDRLNGIVYVANGPGPHPTVILLHGFPGNEKNLDLAQSLRADGWNVLFFHYRGAWGSEGTYSFTHVYEDVAAAADYLRANAVPLRTDANRIILVGHSMGGFASLMAAARDDRIACTAAITPADLAAMASMFEAQPGLARGWSSYSGTLTMLHGFSWQGALDEIMANRPAFDLRALAPRLRGKSVLVIGADRDTDVPAEVIVQPLIDAYEADPAIRTTGVILSGDHSFSWSRGLLIETVTHWAEGCR
jgi:pimeloyl-ACP methyl ester carboxylesterase